MSENTHFFLKYYLIKISIPEVKRVLKIKKDCNDFSLQFNNICSFCLRKSNYLTNFPAPFVMI